MSTFESKFNLWKEETVEQCNILGEKINLDFYPFQSQVCYNPELLILGLNPAGSNIFKPRTVDTIINCGENGENAYIANEHNKDWKINKPILKIFSTPKLRSILEKSVIMNLVYFNTSNFKTISNHKDIMSFCTDQTNKLIFNIIKPKNILLLGFKLPCYLELKIDAKNNSILRNDTGKTSLIMKTEKNGINYYMIKHTSAAYSNDNMNLMKEKFENLL